MTQFWLKLRRNITMDGDLQLARLELETFLSDVTDREHLTSSEFPTISQYARKGQQGYSAEGDLTLLPMLIRRLTFIQGIYIITDDTPQIRDLLAPESVVITYRADDDKLYIEAIPHYPLFEFAEVIARKAKSVKTVKQQLPILLDGLLNRRHDKPAQKIVDMVMSAQITTSPLSHGIHYYKAKFFSRMARSMLNITAGQRDLSLLSVLDPFVGSGTTLLEASQLGVQNVGVDIDPLSVLISQSKLNILLSDSQHLSGAIDFTHDSLRQANTLTIELSPIIFPDWLMKNRKMTGELARMLIGEMDSLRSVVATVDNEMRDILRVILSDAITRRIRFRFMGTGVGRFSLSLSKTPLETLFFRSLDKQLYSLVAWEWLRDTLGLSLAKSDVGQADARNLRGLSQFDLMITSPPYLPASSGRESYAKARMPSLLALGIETRDGVDSLVDSAVGSMDDLQTGDYEATNEVKHLVNWLAHDSLRQIKAEPTARYFADMRATFSAMKHRLNPKGKIVLVSGRQSTFYRSKTREILYRVPVAELLVQEAQIAGLGVDRLVHIPLNKANRNARPRSLDDYDETLIFLSNNS
jgi:hypothetical protein